MRINLSLSNILVFVLIISIFLTLKFSSLTTPEFVPDFFENIFEKPQENTNFYEIFRLLENLSLAYISGFIFYLLIDFFPKRNLEKKAFTIISSDLSEVYLKIKNIVESIILIYDIKIDKNKINTEEAKKLIIYKPAFEKTYYKRKINNNSDRCLFLFHKDLSGISTKIEKNIEELNNLIIIKDCNQNLLQTISKIKSSKLINICKSLKDETLIGREHYISNFDEAFVEFHILFKELEKYNFSKVSFSFEKLTDSEIDLMKSQQLKFVAPVLKQHQNVEFFHAGIQYRIENGKLIQ